MKKFLVVLLSLGLIVAFVATASAVDVKFGGSYQVEGAYENNMFQAGENGGGYFGGRTSSAAVWQRFRLQPVFQIAEGLTMTVRIDALEKQWGNAVWKSGGLTPTDDFSNSRKENASGQKLQENIEFERSYVTFATAVGVFDVGYQMVGRWGTGFNDWENTGARAKFTTKFGPVAALAIWDKVYEADAYRQAGAQNIADGDSDAYSLAAVYSGRGMEAGLLYKYTAANAPRPSLNYSAKLSALSPYMKATFGPVYVEGEMAYVWGKAKEYDSAAAGTNVDAEAFGGYLKAQMNLGPAYFGALAVYIAGDDTSDATKVKGGWLNSKSTNPALIMMGDDYLTDIFPGGNAYDAGNFNSKKNARAGVQMYNMFGGFNPTSKLNVEAGLTFGIFDKTPRVGAVEYVSKKIGWELDMTATYKIYDNLSYMIGGGYLWSGDAFKGTSTTATVGNDYMLMNRLALSF